MNTILGNIVFSLADLIYRNAWPNTAISIFIAVAPILLGLSLKEQKMKKFGIIATIICIFVLIGLGTVYSRYYRFPNIIGLKWDDAVRKIDDSTDANIIVKQPKGFSDNDDSYIFDAETELGEHIEPDYILNTNEVIYLYTTFYKNKIQEYLNGNLTKTDLNDDPIVRITAEYYGDNLWLGQTLDISNVRVVAHHLSKSIQEINVLECDFERTAFDKIGEYTIRISWNDFYCPLYITVEDNRTAAEKARECTNDFKTYYGHAYAIFNIQTLNLDSYTECEEFCEKWGGHLAVIDNTEENNFLFQYVLDTGLHLAFFGYSDHGHEGDWQWVTGNSTYTNWDYNRLNNGAKNKDQAPEDYAEFSQENADGTWNDAPFGTNTYHFICEWE